MSKKIRSMQNLYELSVETRGGGADLSRVVDMLTLFDVTPITLIAHGDAGGLQIMVRIQGDPSICERFIMRLRALVAVARADLRPLAANGALGVGS